MVRASKLIAVIIGMTGSIHLVAQGASVGDDSLAMRYAKVITEDALRAHLEVLASDDFQGRDTGKEGQKMAAAYIRDHFIACGIPPVPIHSPHVIVDGYYQPFTLIEERSGSISITFNGTDMVFLKELLYFNESLKEDRAVGEVTYMGDGSTEVKNTPTGKVVLLSESGEGDVRKLLGRMRGIAERMKTSSAEVVLVSTPRMSELIREVGHYVGGSRMRLVEEGSKDGSEQAVQLILVEQDAMEEILGRKNSIKKLKRKGIGTRVPVDFVVHTNALPEEVVSENVLGFVEGTDKKDELVVITAHYDHIGIENGQVYNGADDDGSGTVAIMMIAEAFAEAKRNGRGPRRSVLVMPVSGEEKGLLGSRYYSDHPVFPLENTVANLNIDMIGRTDSTHVGSEPYVYIIGSDRLSTELHKINEQVNEASTGLTLDYTFNERSDPNRFYYRSDHYNFARKGVPAIFYFSGVHEDYHQPSDTVEKIQFDLLHQRALLVFHTAWRLANREERIAVDGEVE